MTPKYRLGQVVLVEHPTAGKWTGRIRYIAVTGTGDGGFSGIEYEVSNAPTDRTKLWPDDPGVADLGNRWHPLVWEEEIVG